MKIEELKHTDWINKNKIMALSFGLAAGLGLLAQILLQSSVIIITSVAIPFVVAILFYVFMNTSTFIAKHFPYILVFLTFLHFHESYTLLECELRDDRCNLFGLSIRCRAWENAYYWICLRIEFTCITREQ